jgi:peptidoglycan/LPS O-acetylase OafA/YrhL
VPLIAAELPVPGFGDVPATAEPFGAAFWIDLIKYNPLLHLPAFCLGIVTGRIFTRAGECESALRGRGYWLYGPALVTELLLIAFSSSIPYPLVHNGLLLPLHAAIVLGLAFGGGALARFLALTPLVFLGNASYALYILHFPVLRWMRAVSVAFFSAELTGIPITLLYLAIAIGGSCLVFKTIEEPANRFLKAQINLRLGRFRRQPGDAMAMTARSAEY